MFQEKLHSKYNVEVIHTNHGKIDISFQFALC